MICQEGGIESVGGVIGSKLLTNTAAWVIAVKSNKFIPRLILKIGVCRLVVMTSPRLFGRKKMHHANGQ